jgi:DNA-binding transcriptional MerR regulator
MLSIGQKNMAQGLQIGQVARETGLTVDAIRFYEKQHLLKRPPRTEGGFRLFSSQDLQSIHFIRSAQELGFSLNEIRELLILQDADVGACSHVRDLLKSKLSTVREKVWELRKLESHLAADLKKCERRLRHSRTAGHDCCPLLEEISHAIPCRARRPT